MEKKTQKLRTTKRNTGKEKSWATNKEKANTEQKNNTNNGAGKKGHSRVKQYAETIIKEDVREDMNVSTDTRKCTKSTVEMKERVTVNMESTADIFTDPWDTEIVREIGNHGRIKKQLRETWKKCVGTTKKGKDVHLETQETDADINVMREVEQHKV